MNYAKDAKIGGANTTVFQPLPGREKEMVQNEDGAYVFKISKWNMALRWLILGSASGTFYATKQKLTIDNAKNLESCMETKEEGLRLVKLITDVSLSGRAASNAPAIFALALCANSGEKAIREAAFEALPKVCRYSTDLYTFIDVLMTINGHKWNRSLRRAVANWYNKKSADNVAYQVVKYSSRTVSEGDKSSRWSHKDLIFLSHPKPATEEHSKIYSYVIGKTTAEESGNELIAIVEKMYSLKDYKLSSENKKNIVSLIQKYNIPHEAIPNEFKNKTWLWETLLPQMPLGALIRNLPKATSVGAISQSNEMGEIVASRLTNIEQLKRARIHPIGILKAMSAYRIGHNRNMTWSPVRKIVDALDEAFYLCFEFVDKIDDEIVIGWDTSGSMWGQHVLGIDTLKAVEAAAAMIMATLAGAKNARTFMFNDDIKESDISVRQRLDDAIKSARDFTGNTDISLPIQYALDHKIRAKSFVIFTDNATNCYSRHPVEVLKEYRRKMQIPDAKLVVVALTGTCESVADPKDVNCLDVVGLDTSTPKIINAFLKGELSGESIDTSNVSSDVEQIGQNESEE